MEATGRDYYQVLGVPRDAEGAAIKRAYLRLIREHTPESSPDRFREISEAYRILSNPEKRAEYDAEERLPPGVQAKLDRVFKLMETDPPAAKSLAGELRWERDDLRAVRLAYAMALMKAGDADEAVDELDTLCELDPTNGFYVRLLGDALLEAGEEQRGIRCLKQAIALDKDDRNAYISLSRHWMSKGSDDDALEVLSRGISADGSVDVQDLPLFMEKLLILAKLRRWDAMKGTVQTLQRVVPTDDREARSYAAWQLTQLATFFNECKVPHLTKFALDAAYEFDPSRKEIRDGARSIAKAAALHRQVEDLMGDSRIREWVKAYVYALWDENIDEDKKNTVVQNVMIEIASDCDGAASHWALVEDRYPDVAAALQDAFQGLLRGARATRARLAMAARGSTSGESGFPGWLVAVIIGILIALSKNC